MKMPGVTSVMKAVSRAYPFPGNIWPEKVALPLQMLRQPTSRCGAATFLSRCFSSAPGYGIIRPGGVIRPEQIVRPLGIIHPEEGPVFSSRRGLTSGTSALRGLSGDIHERTFDPFVPRLPVLRQMSFYEPGDIAVSNWEDPISFLRRTRIARQVQNHLIDRADLEPHMLIPIGRKLWRSAVRLVSANRRRGYCIAKSLLEKNLVVSSYGTFGLRKAIAEDISGHFKSDFKGYKQVNVLFEQLMKKAYGDDILSSLSPDIEHYLYTLENSVYHDGLPQYHASMLADPGRAWLSIRLASILRGELRSVLGPSAANTVGFILENVPYSSCPLENLHEFFQIWIDHYEKTRTNSTEGRSQQPEVFLELEDNELLERHIAGLRIVALNRNGILHPYGKELSAKRPGSYKVKDVVGLMHCKMPLYLPECQQLFLNLGFWDWLEMHDCFPEDIA